MNKLQVHELLEKTGKWYTAATFLQDIPNYCKGDNSSNSHFQSTEASTAIDNFVQCSKRALYFCRQTLFSIEESLDDQKICFIRDSFFPIAPSKNLFPDNVPYDETIIFNFDASVFAVRVLFEKNLIEALKSLNGNSYEYVEELSSAFYKQLIKPSLSPIRNEVVHYNFAGSTSSYTCSIQEKPEGWDISIRSNFSFKDKESPADLLKLFTGVCEVAIQYINGIFNIIVGSYYQKIGSPKKNQRFVWDNYTIMLRDFEVPNYDVNFE